MTWKYGLLAGRVEHLAQTDAALELYAGPATHGSHQFLFGTLFRAVLCESAMLAMLGTLYLVGYEGLHQTGGYGLHCRTGRGLWRAKVLAAVPAFGGAVCPAGRLHPASILPAVRLQRHLERQCVQPVQLSDRYAGHPPLPHLGRFYCGPVPGRRSGAGGGGDRDILPAGIGVRHLGAEHLSGGPGAGGRVLGGSGWSRYWGSWAGGRPIWC